MAELNRHKRYKTIKFINGASLDYGDDEFTNDTNPKLLTGTDNKLTQSEFTFDDGGYVKYRTRSRATVDSDWSDWGTWSPVGYSEVITAISSIITSNSSVATITEAQYTQTGKVAQLYLKWTNKNAISVPAGGDISNLKIGTVVTGKRPRIYAGGFSDGDGAGTGGLYCMYPNGDIYLTALTATGSARTIAANSTSFYAYFTYILV